MRARTIDGGEVIREAERIAAALCREMAALSHGYWSGRDRRGDPGAALEVGRRLHDRRGIERLRRAVEGAEPGSDSDRRARALLAYALEVRVLAARLEHDARLAAAESAAVARAGGRPVPLARVREALREDADPVTRGQLAAAADALVRERLDPHIRRARDTEREALAEVGYASRREVMLEVERIDIDRLAAEGRRFVAESGDRYRALLAARATKVGLDPGALRDADLPRLGGGAMPLEPEELMARHAEVLEAIGLDEFAGGRISIDGEPRAGKSARSFCTPLEVPGDVRVVVGGDARGRADLASLLHESGHAQHRARTDPSADVAARLLGDASVTESYAFLFERLADDPMDELRGLMLTRRLCAGLAHEVALERGWGREDESEGRARFSSLMSEATGAGVSGDRSLREADPGFYAARYLRGLMLGSLWRRDLEGRVGPGWMGSPATGARMRELWTEGQRRDAERLAVEEAGAERLGFEALGYPAAELPEPEAA